MQLKKCVGNKNLVLKISTRGSMHCTWRVRIVHEWMKKGEAWQSTVERRKVSSWPIKLDDDDRLSTFQMCRKRENSCVEGIPYLELNCYYSFHHQPIQRVCIFFQNMFYLFFKLPTKTFSLEIYTRLERCRREKQKKKRILSISFMKCL